MNIRNTALQAHFAAALFDLAGNSLPHLPGPELGIMKPGNQAGFPLLLVLLEIARKQVLYRMGHRALERQTFYALRAPVGRYLARVHPPYLLGVGLEKSFVETVAEAIPVKSIQL